MRAVILPGHDGDVVVRPRRVVAIEPDFDRRGSVIHTDLPLEGGGHLELRASDTVEAVAEAMHFRIWPYLLAGAVGALVAAGVASRA
jgi:hypothetical protein